MILRSTFQIFGYLLLMLSTNILKAQEMNESVVEDASFVIIDNPQQLYKGILKNGKPYDGYFEKGGCRLFYGRLL